MHKLTASINRTLGWRNTPHAIPAFAGHLLFSSRWGDLLFVDPQERVYSLYAKPVASWEFPILLRHIPFKQPRELILAARRGLQFHAAQLGEIKLPFPHNMMAVFSEETLASLFSAVEDEGEVDFGVDRLIYRVSKTPFRAYFQEPASFHRDLFYWVGLAKR